MLNIEKINTGDSIKTRQVFFILVFGGPISIRSGGEGGIFTRCEVTVAAPLGESTE